MTAFEVVKAGNFIVISGENEGYNVSAFNIDNIFDIKVHPECIIIYTTGDHEGWSRYPIPNKAEKMDLFNKIMKAIDSEYKEPGRIEKI
jgi:hypothetical protein